ncbi:hypothetical protein IAU60_004286 [Kwoniella sp. DSM 27419]
MFRPSVREQGYPPQHQQYGQSPYQQQQQQQQHLQQQQQHQQQQQQNSQQQQQGGGAQSTSGTADGGSGSGGQGQEMNLASVLHYLQSEWRRWERDRNEWEIERAEMRARIALLEGQRRSAENLKVDLLRRVKMLEFALRQERTKTVSSAGRPNSIPPSRLAALHDEDKAKDDKEGSGSEGSQADSTEHLPKLNGVHPAAIGMGKTATAASRASLEPGTWKGIGTAPRDPKSRARSREYLKQCLQEITYLTSPGALNPLPPQPPVDPGAFPIPNTNESGPAKILEDPPDRPRKELPEQTIPSMFPRPVEGSQSTEEPSHKADDGENGAANGRKNGRPENLTAGPAHAPVKADEPKPAGALTIDPKAKAPPVLQPLAESRPGSKLWNGQTQSGEGEQGQQLLTAIYRPDSKAAWREELRAANEEAEKAREERRVPAETTDEETLAALTLPEEEEAKSADSPVDKVWAPRRTLKSHLDIVRSVAFAHGPGIMLASGGDDCTVKVWATEANSVMLSKPSSGELEPIITFRGHTAPVTSVVISSANSTIFSASLDSTIRLWRLPSNHHDPYSAYDPSYTLQTLEGHTDAIWDLAILPAGKDMVNGQGGTVGKLHGGRQGGPGPGVDGKLVSASADGTIKIWQKGQSDQWKLEASYGDLFEEGELPTSLEACNTDPGMVLIGTTTGRVKVFDTRQGRVSQVYGGESAGGDTAEGSRSSPVNAVLSHPTLPRIVAGHEDGYIRFYDYNDSSSAPAHTVLAHPAAVTSLSISPLSPTYILTASVDCTVRLWDLQKKTSVQDLAGHRPKASEGVCAVASHPELNVIATAGADGVVRLWGPT